MKIDKHLTWAKRLATLLDTKFSIAGIKFGLDPMLDIIPGLGSIIGAITSTYVFWIAGRVSVPTFVYIRMAVNILVDLVLGEIPIVGLFFDILYRANIKNIKLLEKYIKFNPQIVEAEIIE